MSDETIEKDQLSSLSKTPRVYTLTTLVIVAIISLFIGIIGSRLISDHIFSSYRCTAATIGSWSTNHLTDKGSNQPTTCGTTIDSALENDCTYDPLATSWIPRSCSRAYIEDYEALRFPFWADLEGTIPLSMDKVPFYLGPFAEGSSAFNADNDTGSKHESLTSKPPSKVPSPSIKSRQPIFDWWYSTQSEHAHHCIYMTLRFQKGVHEIIERNGSLSDLRLDSMSMDFHHTKHCLHNILQLMARHVPNWDRVGVKGATLFLNC